MTTLRYAQCWEDADVLCSALAPKKDQRILAVAGAGDNALALLSHGAKVHAIDYNAAQIAALELRVAALRMLSDDEFMQLLGASDSSDRLALYSRCRPELSLRTREYWDARRRAVACGIAGAGKLERYFTIFRNYVLPLAHDRASVASLLEQKDPDERSYFFERVWDNAKWRALFSIFFSQTVMSRVGRDAAFFNEANDDLVTHLRGRMRHALVDQDPSRNPYLHWILTGRYGNTVPYYLQRQSLAQIRGNLDRLTWECTTLGAWASKDGDAMHGFALSDIFEYMGDEQYSQALREILRRSASGARLCYWNMLVPRSRPAAFSDRLSPSPIAEKLFLEDRAFFYRAFVVEDVG